MFERRDEFQWIDQETGFRCCIRRHPRYGTLNGYIGLPPGHPGYGQDPNKAGNEFWWDYSVHGGLSFGGYMNNPEYPKTKGTWSGSKFPEENNLWWIGFDCHHAGDAVPSSVDHIVGFNEYRDIGFVRIQIEGLIEELEEKGEEMEEVKVSPEFLERLESDIELLKEFGVRPSSWDPGITFGNERINVGLNEQEWGWLKPLLQELKNFRTGEN